MKDFLLISLPSPATRRKRTTTGLTVDLLGVSQGVCLELATNVRAAPRRDYAVAACIACKDWGLTPAPALITIAPNNRQ
jgi:hypothetical protein